MNKTNVHPNQFGKDHWSLLAYVETCCVENQALDKRRLRCNERTHPIHAVNLDIGNWQSSDGTRLAGYFDSKNPDLRLPDHDDWDCLDDLEAAGYIEILSEANAFVKTTDLGNIIVGKLRTHKSNGGQFADFKII